MICFILYQQEFELPVTADASCSDWYIIAGFFCSYIFFTTSLFKPLLTELGTQGPRMRLSTDLNLMVILPAGAFHKTSQSKAKSSQDLSIL